MWIVYWLLMPPARVTAMYESSEASMAVPCMHSHANTFFFFLTYRDMERKTHRQQCISHTDDGGHLLQQPLRYFTSTVWILFDFLHWYHVVQGNDGTDGGRPVFLSNISAGNAVVWLCMHGGVVRRWIYIRDRDMFCLAYIYASLE